MDVERRLQWPPFPLPNMAIYVYYNLASGGQLVALGGSMKPIAISAILFLILLSIPIALTPAESSANSKHTISADLQRADGCCQGTRGNVNGAGIVDLADLSALVNCLTGGGFVPPCLDAANVNGAGIVDLADLSALVSYLTGGGYELPDCLAPGFYPNTVGSYWVYADTTFDKKSSLVLFTTIDSVAIIGTYHDTLGTWSVLNHAVSWVSDTFMVRGDTLFSREVGYLPDSGLAPSFASAEYIPARDTAFVFNVFHEDLLERRTVVRLNTLLICGAGSFARCVHYYEAGASEIVYHDMVAPNVGLVYSSWEITPMGHPEIDQLSVQWLIRYHIAP
jgi:hypothetical protein